MPLKFLLDEHVSPAIAHGLRLHGIDVVTVHEIALNASDDRDIIERAFSESRVVVTNDEDFLIHSAAGVRHSGVAYAHPGFLSIGDTIRYLRLMDACYDADEMRTRIEYMSK